MNRTRFRLGAWTATLCTLLGLLHEMGRAFPVRSLSLSNVQNPDSVTVCVFAVVRIGLIVVVAYLLLTTLLASASPAAASWRCVPGVVRRFARPALGIALAGVVTVSASAAHAAPGPDGRPVLHHVDPQRLNAPSVSTSAPTTSVPSTHAVSPPKTSTSVPPSSVPTSAVPTSAVPTTSNSPASTSSPETLLYEVKRGDNFWSIAAQRVHQAKASPSDVDVEAYWRLLIERNRTNLAVPNDPSILFRGQTLELPPV